MTPGLSSEISRSMILSPATASPNNVIASVT
jgi:hypothetical protein